MLYIESLNSSLHEIMEENEGVYMIGEDIVDPYGGAFKVTKGLSSKYSGRVLSSPISEAAILGIGTGMAIQGFKPIVELQFADFVSVGFNQIVNNLAKTYYRWGQSVNVTLRMPTGGSIGAGPFHSQSNEAWFFHVPGLKIVYPSTAYDAKGLLNSSIDDSNTVLFFEHKALYRSIKDEVPESDYNIEIGKSKIVKEGKDLSILTYGLGVIWAKEYAQKSNYDVEIIDLRTLLPLDVDGIISSVSKTNRVLILHEDNITGGIGAEISALITENVFELLDAPIMRLGAIDTPVPFASDLEKEIYLPINKIEQKIKELLNF